MLMISITNSQIHLWTTPYHEITDEQLISRYHALLNESEKHRLLRFKFYKDRLQFLVTRALVKSVLSQYFTGVAEKSWVFQQNKFGKPEISNRLGRYPVKFNLAHTDGLVTLAITPNNDIGIDVEHLNRPIAASDIAGRYFSEQERSELSRLPDDKKSQRFFELWTLKESYIKARGMGLSLPLDNISFSLNNSLGIGFSADDAAGHWEFMQFKYRRAFVIAIAVNNPHPSTQTQICCRDILPLVNHREYQTGEFRCSRQPNDAPDY